ncbi:DUF4992 family lipoprotein [Bacteroidales bacterium OttesenSCG-928-L03]|nr:DUF4992 family lipoprotein [Bacteroidales bacterium OttesenSCG-928-L03]
MKMNLNLIKKSGVLLCTMLTLFFTACIDGYDGDETWSSSVKNATLESPSADGITVSFSADGTEQTITWPLVLGAGGYEVTVYNMDDPENPKLVGEENQVVDGVSLTCPSMEDTRFMVKIKTLGNEKNNNKGSDVASEKKYDNLLPVYATIPDGSNLTEYFATNPIPENGDAHLCYELVAGGNYTMTGHVNSYLTDVTFRGNKVDHANLKVTDGSFVSDGAGLQLKFIDIDYSDFSGTVTSNAVILMNGTFNPIAEANLSEGGYVVVPTSSPIAIQSCKITGLVQYLFFDNSKKYGIGTFLIKDCIIGQNTGAFGNALVRFGSGMVKDFTLTNSTLYNEVAPSAGSNRFMQISSGNVTSVKPAGETWASASMTITNNTFYQAGKGAQSFNSNGAMGRNTDKVTVQRNVFVDSYENGRIVSRFRRGNTTAAFSGGQNSQWYDGALFTGNQDKTADVNYFETDPQLTYLGNGVFQMKGAQQIAARTGDPRWLPEE